MSQKERILEILKDGRPHSTFEVDRLRNILRLYGAIVFNLRKGLNFTDDGIISMEKEIAYLKNEEIKAKQ